MKFKLYKLIVLILMLSLVLNCGGDDNPDDPAAIAFDQRVQNSREFENPEELAVPEVTRIIRSQEQFNVPEDEAVFSGGTRTRTDSVMATYNCTTKEYRAAPGYNELFILDPTTTNVIYPGAVLDGETISNGQYLLLPGARKPLRISTSIVGLNNTASVLVDEPTHSAVRDGIQELLSPENTQNLTPPANSVFSTSGIFSQTQFSLAMGTNIEEQTSSTFQNELNFNFNFDYSVQRTRQEFVARFAQTYYTVDIDLPGRPSDLFEDYDDLSSGYSPVYVSTVTYGRHVLLNLKSYRDQFDVGTALSASIRAEVPSGDELSEDSNFSNQHRRVLENSDLNSKAVGGAGSVCNGITDIDKLYKCINEGGLDYQDAQPISYTLRFLRDNSIAKVVLAEDYTARQCDLQRSSVGDGKVRWWITQMGFADNKEERGNGWDEIYGKIYMRQVQDPNRNQRGGRVGCTFGNSGSTTVLFDRPTWRQFVALPGRNRPRKWNNLTTQTQYQFWGVHEIPDAFRPDSNDNIVHTDANGEEYMFEICFDLWEEDSNRDDRFHYSLHLPQSVVLDNGFTKDCSRPYEIEVREDLSTNASKFIVQIVSWNSGDRPTPEEITRCSNRRPR